MKNNVWEYQIRFDPLIVIRQKYILGKEKWDIKEYKSQMWSSTWEQKWWGGPKNVVHEIFTFGDCMYNEISEEDAYKEMKKFMNSIGKEWTKEDMDYLK